MSTKSGVWTALSVAFLVWTGGASAQDTEGAPEASAEVTTEQVPPAAAPDVAAYSAPRPDGMRFRWGIAGGAGPLIVKSSNDSYHFTYAGADVRLGLQINDAFGVYAQPQFGVYWAGGSKGVFGTGGLVGVSFGGDYTLFDRLFFGAGLGYGVLNNPSGFELHVRAGGYPLMSKSTTRARRKGLMLGLDFRVHFVSQNNVDYTAIAPTFNIGYEAF